MLDLISEAFCNFFKPIFVSGAFTLLCLFVFSFTLFMLDQFLNFKLNNKK